MARSTTRVRSGLVGLLFVLACISLVLSTVAVWAHQTLLVTDRFVAVTSRVVDEPEVQARRGQRLASEIVIAADVQGRIAGVLPGRSGVPRGPADQRRRGRPRQAAHHVLRAPSGRRRPSRTPSGSPMPGS